jgi:hypothetical protein
MGGGKETPRQKMIGMMYLVLMAMLAMNVSKSIIDAFVAIEENIQIANQNEYGRGNEKRVEIQEKVTSGDTPDLKAKAKRLLAEIDKIDKLTAENIQYIDALKLEILTEIKEDETKLKEGPEKDGFIIIKDFDPKNPTRPIRFRVGKVQNKDKYDEVMRIMGINNSTEKPEMYSCKSKFAKDKKAGIELWNKMQDFRENLCKIIVESSSNDSVKYKFDDPKINKYEDQESLKAEIAKLFKSKKWKFHQSDSAVISDTYIALTKNEMVPNEHEEGEMEHWIGKTFNHAPAVGALASLSSLQKEILTARADAISVIRLRIGGGDYSFNAIKGFARPRNAVVMPGDEIEIEVSMAAYDTDKQPDIKPNQGSLKGKPVEGVGIVTARATSGKMEFTGTVAITNKFGKQRIESYKTEVYVATKSSSLEMPEYSILYAGYDNKIIPSAAGAVSFDISVSGASKVKKGEMYYVKPPLSAVGSKVSIKITGKGPGDKSIDYGKAKVFDVRRFPPGQITSKTISKLTGGLINVEMDKSSPIKASFTVESVEVLGIENGVCPGKIVPAAKLKTFRPGQTIGVRATVKNSITGGKEYVPGFLLVQ